MFLGTFPITLDSKGRLSIPAKLRDFFAEESDNALWITADRGKNLLVYTLAEWEKVMTQLNKLPTFDKVANSLKRLYIGSATECRIDGSGRVLIPPVLRQRAEMERKVMLVGMGNKFELWSEENWIAVNEYDAQLLKDEDLAALSNALGSLVI